MEGFAGTLSNRTRPATDGSALAKRRRVYVMLLALVEDLGERGKLDLRETFMAEHSSRQKRGPCRGKNKRGKGTKIMAVADAAVFPLALHVASASPHEVTLVEDTLDCMFTNELPVV